MVLYINKQNSLGNQIIYYFLKQTYHDYSFPLKLKEIK